MRGISLSEKRSWTHEETFAFLRAYLARIEEFKGAWTKTNAMKNVLQDLRNQNVLMQPTTVHMLQSKMKNLRRGLNLSKDPKHNGHTAPSSEPFKDIMEQIFGTDTHRPSDSLNDAVDDPLDDDSQPSTSNKVAIENIKIEKKVDSSPFDDLSQKSSSESDDSVATSMFGKKRKRRNSTSRNVDLLFLQSLNELTAKKDEDEEDEDWHFLQSIRCQMRKMPKKQKIKFKINMLTQASEATADK